MSRITAISNIEKEEMIKEVGVEIASLREFSNKIGKLVDSLQKTLHADVSFSTIEEGKEVLKSVPEVRSSIEKLCKVLRARAHTRMKAI